MKHLWILQGPCLVPRRHDVSDGGFPLRPSASGASVGGGTPFQVDGSLFTDRAHGS